MMMMMMMMTGSSNKLHVGRKSPRHGRNHPTGVGTRRTRISSNFGDYGDWGPSVVWSPSTFATGCNFFRWAVWEAYSASPDLLVKFREK